MRDDERFDADVLISMPRLSGLTVSPDGRRLVTSVTRPATDGKMLVSSLWLIDLVGTTPPRRLTRSAPGESAAAFASDGSLLFLSSRPDPNASEDTDTDPPAALWRLPAGGGEPWVVAAPPGGVDAVRTARNADVIVFAANTHAGTEDWAGDAEREKARRDQAVTAQLFTDYPVRHWDHYLGPRERHLYAAPLGAGDEPISEPIDLVPEPGRSLDDVRFDITPDGTKVVTSVHRLEGDLRERYIDLVAIDVETRERRVLAREDAWFEAPRCSPDGRWTVSVRESKATPDRAPDVMLWLVNLHNGDSRALTPKLDLWPQDPVWSPDGSAIFFTADCEGRTPPYRVELETGRVNRLSARGAFSDLCPSPDGRSIYALQSMITSPPQPVAFGSSTTDQDTHTLTDVWVGPTLNGRIERVGTAAEDGADIWSWLLVPPGADAARPAPLAVLIHGGPLASWSGWHWRWSPHVLLDRGYAVLLPDPALSTGYGQRFIERGWGRWGDVVYRDLMAAVDAVTWRPYIDSSRTAALGGSFGGYMANWIAGHTNRFSAIVTHASLWDLTLFHGTTDWGVWWEQQFGDPYVDDERYRENSPHLHIGQIHTPMLVIHGERDYRVPIDQALTLWTDLRRHGVESQFLYFPDEHHWILKPGHVRLWYETVLAFLDHHVLGEDWQRPDLL